MRGKFLELFFIIISSQPSIKFIFFTLFVSDLDSHDTLKKLPIHGDEDEITLSLNFPDGFTNNVFKLNGKYLQLVHPLDRDKENLSHILFTVSKLKLLQNVQSSHHRQSVRIHSGTSNYLIYKSETKTKNLGEY